GRSQRSLYSARAPSVRTLDKPGVEPGWPTASRPTPQPGPRDASQKCNVDVTFRQASRRCNFRVKVTALGRHCFPAGRAWCSLREAGDKNRLEVEAVQKSLTIAERVRRRQ